MCTGKHLCRSLFFDKVAGLRLAKLLKKRLHHRCLRVNIAKFLRTSFLRSCSKFLEFYAKIANSSEPTFITDAEEGPEYASGAAFTHLL